MKMNNRLLSLILVVVMILGMFPLSAIATAEDHSHEVIHIEGCSAECAVEGCACTCHVPAHVEGCSAECAVEGCACTCHQVMIVNDDPTRACDKCDGIYAEDGVTVVHNSTCPTRCSCTPVDGVHVAPCEFASKEVPPCEKCNAVKNADGTIKHETTCEKVQYVPTCTGKLPCSVEGCTNTHCTGDAATCPIAECACKKPLCDKCKATKDGETIVHEENCLSKCKCEAVIEGVHSNWECPFYVEPATEPDEVIAFIDFMKALPASEILKYFQTKDELAWADAAIPMDVAAKPEKEQAAFDAAKSALLKKMDANDADLETAVNDLLFEMLIAYEDANWAVEDDIENHMGEDAELLEAYDALLAYVDTGIQTYGGTRNTFTPTVVGETTNNINVTLFDYGTYITHPTYAGKDYRTLVFHGWPSRDTDQGIHDENGGPMDTSGKIPMLTELRSASAYNNNITSFVTDLTDGYPYITEWLAKGGAPSAPGSLQYLYDLKGPAYRPGENGNAGYVPQYDSDGNVNSNHSNYEFKRFDVGTVKLFKKNGNYYEYNSSYNAAYYDGNTLASYNYALRPFTAAALQGHFLPFNSFNDGKGLDQQNGVTRITDDQGMIVDPKYQYKEATSGVEDLFSLTGKTNMAYGMLVEFTFSMPAGGEVDKTDGSGKEDMVFNFSGDDDVYVYIDGYPVLNIGGTHNAWSGTINFATGAVNVYESEKAEGLNQVTGGAYKDKAATAKTCTTLKEIFTQTFQNSGVEIVGDSFRPYSEHTLRFFYMERGAGAANCRLQFNLELVPEATVSVEKQEVNINHDLNAEYTFQVLDSNSNVRPNERYTITTAGSTEESEVKYTDSEGKFTLKHGEKANFKSLLAGQRIKVKEIKDPNDSYATTCKINNQSIQLSDLTTGVIDLTEDAVALVFTNTWDVENITINKTLDDVDNKAQSEFDFNVTINGKAYTGSATKQKGQTSETVTVSEGGVFTLEANESITISGVPETWKFKVKEMEPTAISGYKYEKPKFNNDEKEFGAEAEYTAGTAVTVANKLTPLFGDLTIKKTGIQGIDHDGSAERQSTIFKVAGTSASGERVELEVVVVENGSVTIKNIPVGTAYTVTEVDSWSWRYDAKKENGAVENEKTGVVVTASEPYTVVTFNNDRTNQYWLSGDNYLKNLFTMATKTTE